MFQNFKISLIIQGSTIDINELCFLENYGEIKLYKKGECISCVTPPLESDCFKFTYKFKENLDKSVEEFYEIIKSINLKKFKESDLKLRFYIQSYDAQIMFSLSNKSINMLSELGINIEFSILSWGEVCNDS